MASSAETPPQSRRLKESIERQWFLIQGCVQKFDPSASASDFADRIVRRLRNRIEEDTESAKLDEAVLNTARLLSYEDRRKTWRDTRRWGLQSISEMNGVVDPAGVAFATGAELEAQIDFLRRQVSADQLSFLESLYGFEEEVTVQELAKRLGMQPAALYQKTHRLLVKLRRQFRSQDNIT